MARDVRLLHPRIRAICGQFMIECQKAGIDLIITQTLRTKAEQDAIYAQGRTTPGKIVTKAKYPMSPHCWGCAFDIAIKVAGKIVWDERKDLYEKAGAIGKKLGLVWGGDFKSFVDRPHFEDPKYIVNKSVNTLVKNYGAPGNFIKTWNESEEEAVEDITIVKGNRIMKGFVKNGTSYAPVRELAETLGATVMWDASKKRVVIKEGAKQ